MATVIGSATIKIMPDSRGFTAALNGQLRGVNQSVTRSMGGANRAMGQTGTNLRGLTDSLGRFGSRMILTGEAMTFGITRPLIQMGSAIVGTAAKFDEAKRTIAAVAELDILGENNAAALAELDAIGEIAIELGRKGKFSALEMAEGFVEIARAGIETKEGLEAVGDVVRKIATVESIAMGTAAELLINVFAGLGGQFEETGDSIFRMADGMQRQKSEFGGLAGELELLGDILALVSAKTTTDIVDLGNAFRYAGPVARSAGVDVEEAAAALGILAQSGFNATVGGTALRNIITRLAIPTKMSAEIFEKFGLSVEQAFAPENNAPLMESEIADLIPTLAKAGLSAEEIDEALRGVASNDAAQTMEEVRIAAQGMGLEIFDANGEMVPLVHIFDQFNDSGARIGDIMKLFGQRAGPAFLALMSNRDAMASLHGAALEADGSLENMSKTIEGSATIQFARLKNALVELAIRIGESGMLQFFTDLSLRLTRLVHVLADSQPQMFKYALALGAIVAAMGPLRILIGLSATAVKSFLSIVLFAGTPFGPIILGLGALSAAFGFIVANSKDLQAAFGNLFGALRSAFGPIFEQFARILGGLVTGIGNLAGMIGDALAPTFQRWADSLNAWISSPGPNGLTQWLSDVIDWVGRLAVAVRLLWMDFEEAGGPEAVITAFTRLRDVTVKLWDTMWPLVTELWPAMVTIGKVVGTTLAAAFIVAWNAGDKLISMFDRLLDFVGPIVNFFAKNLEPILFILALRFLFLRTAVRGTIAGIISLGNGIRKVTIRMGDFAETVGVRVGTAFRTLGLSLGRFAFHFIPATSGALGRLQARFGIVGAAVARFGTGFQQIMTRLGTAIRRFGQAAAAVAGNLNAVFGGFMSGVFAAQAETMTDKVIALGGALTGMLTAIVMMPGPIGLTIALLTGLAAIMGKLMAETKESTSLTINYASAVSSLAAAMKQSQTTQLSGIELFDKFNDSLRELNFENIAVFANNMDHLGVSLTDMFLAMEGGSVGVATLNDEMAETFAQGVLNRDIMEGWSLELRSLQRQGRGRGFRNMVIDLEDVETALRDATSGTLQVKNALGEVVAEGEDLEELTRNLKGLYDSNFLGQAMLDFGLGIDAARREQEALQPIYDMLQREQEDLNDRSQSWVDKIDEVNQGFDAARSRIMGLFDPLVDVERATAELLDGMISGLDGLRDEATGLLSLEAPSLGEPGASEWYRATDAIRRDWGGVVASMSQEVARENPFLPVSEQAKIVGERLEELKPILIESLTLPEGAGGLGLTLEQANELAGVFLTMPQGITTDIAVEIIGEEATNEFFETVAELSKKPREVLLKMNTAMGGTLTGDQVLALADQFRWMSTADDIQLTSIFNGDLGSLPPGISRKAFAEMMARGDLSVHTYDDFINIWPRVNESNLTAEQKQFFAAAFAGVGLGDEEVQVTLSVISDMDQSVLSTEQLHALLAFGVIHAGQIEATVALFEGGAGGLSFEEVAALLAMPNFEPVEVEVFLNVVPQIESIGNVSSDEVAEWVQAWAREGRMEESITTTLDVLTNDPALFAEIQGLLDRGVIDPVQIPVVIEMSASGGFGAIGDMSDAQINEMINFIVGMANSVFGGGRAQGGIVTKDLLYRLAEDGPEAVIPLNKPGRAAAVMADAGLFEFAIRSLLTKQPQPISAGGGDSYIGQFIDLLGTNSFGGAAGPSYLPIEFPGMDTASGLPTTDVEIRLIIVMVGTGEALAQIRALTGAAATMAHTVASAFMVANAAIMNSFMGVIGAMMSVIAIQPAIFAMVQALGGAFDSMAAAVVRAITAIVVALSQIPFVMAGVARSLTQGFSRPFSLIARQVWNPFASFINSASTAVGLGALLPTGLSIPVFHKGGIVGGPMPDSFDPSSDKMMSNETLALLRKGEGVMTDEMMASMTSSQLQAFKSGEKRWWAVGGPYEDGTARAASRVTSGLDPLSDLINYQELVDTYNSTIKPMLDGAAAAFPNNMIARVAAGAMSKVGDATLDYARGYSDEIANARAQAIGLPAGFDLAGTVPAGFDMAGWRSVLGANRGKNGNWPLLAAYLRATGVPHILTSTLRPGSITATGNLSNHALGRAIDVIGPSGGVDTPEMLRINHAFAPVIDLLSELIYSGPGAIQTQAYTGITRAMHHNHVHAALRDGGIVQDLVYAMLGENGPEVVLPLGNPMRALSLARRSGLMRTLQQGQQSSGDYRAPGAATNRNSAIDSGDGGPLGGTGNTYHVHGQSAKEVEAKIRNRDRAAMRKRR